MKQRRKNRFRLRTVLAVLFVGPLIELAWRVLNREPSWRTLSSRASLAWPAEWGEQ
jgi:hypothetical protein